MKSLLSIIFLLLPFSYTDNNDTITIYGEPLIFKKNISGEISYYIQESHPEYPIRFVVQITIEVPKDTVFVKPGYKKY